MSAPALRSNVKRAHDPELVRRFRAGDELAFELIATRHRPRLLAFARKLLGPRRDDADDVVQEALMRAYRALRRDDRSMNLGPWLVTLTRNCCLDELARRHLGSVDIDAPAAELALVDARCPAALVEERARLHDMLDGIAALPSAQRHALVRHQVDGASHAEIADELGITAVASRSLVFRARQGLLEQRGLTDDERCQAARRDLLAAHRTGGRASARTHRHVLTCPSCRAYRARVRALRSALHALHPGPLLLALLAVKGAVTAKASGVVAGGTAKAAGAAAVVAVAGAAAVGVTVIAAGQPSPLTVKSPALPRGVIRAGAPLPPGTAMVTRAVTVANARTNVELGCPAGLRVADLLAPNDPAVTAAYRDPRGHGLLRHATIALAGHARSRVGVAILCRRPDATGALAVSPTRASDASQRRVVTVCVPKAFVRDRPAGAPEGSVAFAEPLESERRRGAWRKVRTQYGAEGWLMTRATCA